MFDDSSLAGELVRQKQERAAAAVASEAISALLARCPDAGEYLAEMGRIYEINPSVGADAPPTVDGVLDGLLTLYACAKYSAKVRMN
jgi:hypothetical protein